MLYLPHWHVNVCSSNYIRIIRVNIYHACEEKLQLSVEYLRICSKKTWFSAIQGKLGPVYLRSPMMPVASPYQNSLKLPIHEWIGPVVNSEWNRRSAEAIAVAPHTAVYRHRPTRRPSRGQRSQLGSWGSWQGRDTNISATCLVTPLARPVDSPVEGECE